ncbi:hypothetical protein R1sor_019282 [Riccia sorocarpa]|uniref:Reverse transcriptase zinc-binding domain-containing protein n=1 Tax=Riccia sorocarpa TaxID=122646 RepID=A0ABD3IFQ6_9MARC
MHYMGRFLQGENTEWATMMRELGNFQVWLQKVNLDAVSFRVAAAGVGEATLPPGKDGTSRDRAEKMHIDPGICKRCDRTVETTDHLFWTCPRATETWERIRTRAEETSMSFTIPNTLMDTIDTVIPNSRKGGCLIHVLTASLQAIWKDRNQKVFHNKDVSTPIDQNFQAARYEAEGSIARTGTEGSWLTGLATLRELSKLLGETDPSLLSQQGSNQQMSRLSQDEIAESLSALLLVNPMRTSANLQSGSSNRALQISHNLTSDNPPSTQQTQDTELIEGLDDESTDSIAP